MSRVYPRVRAKYRCCIIEIINVDDYFSCIVLGDKAKVEWICEGRYKPNLLLEWAIDQIDYLKDDLNG